METVSSQVCVCAPVGGEVLLPCVCSKLHHQPHKVSVFWRDGEDRNTLDIVLSSPYTRFQHRLFKGRVESFPHLYKEGNYSVLLKNLQMSDSNRYDCYIQRLGFKETISLTVSGECVSEPQAPPEPSSGDTRFTPGCLTASLTLLTFLQLNPS